MAPLEFPSTLAREISLQWAPRAGVIEPPAAAFGGPPGASVVTSGGFWWECTFADVQVSSPEQILAWRALKVRLQNGAAPIIVPFLAESEAPIDPAAAALPWHPSFSSGEPFANGALFSSTPITITTLAAAALRATRMRLSVEEGRSLRAGEAFSIRHPTKGWRLYWIGEVEEDTGSLTQPWVHFGPPLREAVDAGVELEFANPRCLMRLSGSSDLSLRFRRLGSPSITFREAF